MTDEPAVEELLNLCKEHVTRARGTDCDLSMKAIRRRLNKVFWSWSHVKCARQADIAVAVLMDLRIMQLVYHRENVRIAPTTNNTKSVFRINSLELIKCLNQN